MEISSNCEPRIPSNFRDSKQFVLISGQRLPHAEHLQGRQEGVRVLGQEGPRRPRHLREQVLQPQGRAVRSKSEQGGNPAQHAFCTFGVAFAKIAREGRGRIMQFYNTLFLLWGVPWTTFVLRNFIPILSAKYSCSRSRRSVISFIIC